MCIGVHLFLSILVTYVAEAFGYWKVAEYSISIFPIYYNKSL